MPSKTQAGITAEPASVVMRLDDQSYFANVDILAGVRFFATLHVTTPLKVLTHHGEFYAGPPSMAPQYGTRAEEIWIFELRDGPSQTDPVQASDIGPIRASRYLPFLRLFRVIFESEVSHTEKLGELDKLANNSTEFQEIWHSLSKSYDDFPDVVFYFPLTMLDGVGRKLACKLYRAGIRSVDDIAAASSTQLCEISGVGSRAAEKLKAGSAGLSACCA